MDFGEEIREQKRSPAIQSGMSSQDEFRSSLALPRDVAIESARPTRMNLFWRLLRWLVLIGLVLGGLALWKWRHAASPAEGNHEASSKRAAVPVVAGNVEKGVKWIVESNKNGRFASTQSTILALRAIVAYDTLRARPKVPATPAPA